MDNNKAATGGRDNVANQLMIMAENLSDQMQALSVRVNSRLAPISRPEPPTNPSTLQKEDEEWPPFFAKMRQSLSAIQCHVRNIEGAIDRLEV